MARPSQKFQDRMARLEAVRAANRKAAPAVKAKPVTSRKAAPSISQQVVAHLGHL